MHSSILQLLIQETIYVFFTICARSLQNTTKQILHDLWLKGKGILLAVRDVTKIMRGLASERYINFNRGYDWVNMETQSSPKFSLSMSQYKAAIFNFAYKRCYTHDTDK